MTARAALAVALIALAAPAVAHADDTTRPITLAEALATARAHNPGYLAAVAARDGAAAQVRGAAGVDDRVLEAGVDGLTRAADPVAGPFFQETGVDAVGGHVALWQPLPWGGRVGVSVAEQVARTSVRVAAGGPVTDITTTVHQPRAELVWQQPLLRDRGRANHGAPAARAAAAASAEEAARVAAEVALAHDVERAYWELAYAEREVEIRASALALARDQLSVTRARAEVGKVAELEVATAEQAIAAREAAQLAAEQDRAARAVALRVLLGDEAGDARLVADDDLAADVAAPATADARARALAFAPRLRALEHQGRAATIELAVATADTRPRLDLIVRGGPMGNADSAGEAWAQLGRFDGYEASAALSFSLPVGNRAATGRRDVARAARQRVELEGAALRGALTAEVTRAVDAVALSERRIAAATQAARLAQRTVELERDRWQAGAGTNFDVLIRQDQAVAAEAALARARADRRLALAALAALTGP
ncbi:MAG: TolC family protein [Myxococcales bacterium]|nr:TolC family protein [Myxococcales bacterium]